MPQITDEQKQKIVSICISAFVSVLLAVLAVLGYNIAIVQPQQQAFQTYQAVQDARMHQLKIELGFEEPAPGEVVAESLNGGGWLCRTGDKPCIDSRYGRDLIGYSNNGVTEKWKIEGTDGSFDHYGFQIFDPETAITVTNGTPFTPTGTYQKIQAAGTVTPTLAVTNTAGVAYKAGSLLRLVNVSAQTVNIADSGNVKLSTAWAGGQTDSLALMFDGTYWIEIARSDN